MHELKEQLINFFAPFLDWCMHLGELGLFILALIESSFFPIPPDFIYIPMILAGANNPYALAAICTAGSVIGAVVGYFIGLYGGRPVTKLLLGKYADIGVAKAEEFFRQYGSAAVLIAAFTPIPYKVFTIAGGIARMNIMSFTLYSIIGRGARFFAVTFLLVQFGEMIMKNFFKLSLVVVLLGLIVYFTWKKFYAKNSTK
jgi:membrane protein YqaA with SNARE-associated domain